MQKITGISMALLFISTALSADQTVSPPSHPKKVYLDPVQNKVFWPLEKPVWIRLAESSDKNAASYLLTNDDDSTGARSGIRLDISGSQFIRWKNFLTEDSVKLRFIADGDAPECAITVTGEKTSARPTDSAGSSSDVQQSIKSRQIACYSKKVSVSFSGKDRLSGLDKIYFSVNYGPFQEADNLTVFDKEALYRIAYYAVDRVGNASVVSFQAFSIDASPPTTLLSFNGRFDEHDTIFSRLQSIAFTGVDTLSGIGEIRYRFNSDKKFSTFKKPVSLKELSNGAHTVHYFAIDNAGNEEKPKSRVFFIDDLPPVPVISFVGDYFTTGDNQDYISPRTVVKITASDEKSGVETIEYAIENADFIPYTLPFRFSPQLKKCAIEVRATDKAGNLSKKYSASARMDAQPPKTEYSISGPLHQKGGILYLTTQSRVTLTSKDEGSGVASLQYSINDAAPAKYTQPVSLSSEGRHLFKYWGIDKVNNNEDTRAFVIMIDNTAPKIVETFSIQTPPLDSAGKTIPKYPINTALFLAASDASGIDGIWYSINGKKEGKYNGTLQFEHVGMFTIVIKAKDILGNVGEKTLGFEIIN
jgi:hypothetical protein